MPRPCKNRFISGRPLSVVYKPAKVPARTLEWLTLGLDEFETIRLLDHQGLDQNKVAQLMRVSRPTVTRIYASARKKIADALTEGKAIYIEGGPVEGKGFEQRPQAGPMRRRHGHGAGHGQGRRRGRGRW